MVSLVVKLQEGSKKPYYVSLFFESAKVGIAHVVDVATDVRIDINQIRFGIISDLKDK